MIGRRRVAMKKGKAFPGKGVANVFVDGHEPEGSAGDVTEKRRKKIIFILVLVALFIFACLLMFMPPAENQPEVDPH
jgi:hypothetical protein